MGKFAGTAAGGSVTAMAEPTYTIGIVGAGIVAQALGRLLAVAGAPIAALGARDRTRGERAARFIGGSVEVVGVADVPRLATHVLIAVSDRGIEPVAASLAAAGMRSGVALHTCGAKGPDALAALRRADVACGVLHPLQTFVTPEQGVDTAATAAFAAAGDRAAVDWADRIAALMTGGRAVVLHVAPDRLADYHAAAVMASNAVVAALDAAVLLMAQAGVGEDDALRALAPLAFASVRNAVAFGPRRAATGPVVRGDGATVALHRAAVRGIGPGVAALYDAAARHLLEMARARGLGPAGVRSVEQALAGKAG
jgi:predicted short-subunit dehydrogenase-like oxidoreductase (DUF2520 family)